MAKRDIDHSANLPFQRVKESFEVCGLPLPLLTRVTYQNKFQAETLATPSVVATCLEELPELGKDGVDEEAIRAVGGTIFLGERRFCMTIGT